MADPYQGKGGPTDPVIEETDDFSGGLVTVAPSHLIETKQIADCRNVTFTKPFGAITPRKGHKQFQDSSAALPKSFGFEYDSSLFNPVPSKIHMGSTQTTGGHSGDLYEQLSATYSYAHTSGSTKGEDWRFAQFKTLMLAVNPFEPTLKYVSPNWVALLGTPPANGHVINTHRGRVWIGNTSAGSSRLHYSALNNAEDWTTANDAGFIDVNPDDGDFITGIVSLSTVLIIFKNTSTWAITGGGPTSFVLKLVSGTVGCLNDRTIARGDQFAIFLSRSGIYNVTANANGVLFVNYNIAPLIDAQILGDDSDSSVASFTNSQVANCAGGRWKTEYWLCKYTSSFGSQMTIVFDFVFGTFTVYTNIDCRMFVTAITGELIGLKTDFKLYTMNEGWQDPGSTDVSWYFYTKAHDFGTWSNRKIAHDLIIQARGNVGSGTTIGVDYIVNGNAASAVTLGTFTDNVGGASAHTDVRVFYKNQTHFPASTQPNYLQFKIYGTQNNTTGPSTIYSYSSLAEIYERENG